MKLDEFFKFKIGETVVHVSNAKEKPVVLFIVNRQIEQCPGGVQLHYICRHIDEGFISIQYIKCNEIELKVSE